MLQKGLYSIISQTPFLLFLMKCGLILDYGQKGDYNYGKKYGHENDYLYSKGGAQG